MNTTALERTFVGAASADLANSVRRFLRESRGGFGRVSVWAEGQTVTLSGPVRSFFLRQVAISLAKQVPGVCHVVDDLEVDLEGYRPSLKGRLMGTHNVFIYHCITCGRIAHAEVGTEPPQCCGHAMTRASEDTLHTGEVAGETPGGQSETPPVESKGREQPH